MFRYQLADIDNEKPAQKSGDRKEPAFHAGHICRIHIRDLAQIFLRDGLGDIPLHGQRRPGADGSGSLLLL